MLKTIKVVLFSWFLLMLVTPAFSQNTKGDKPASERETRFVKTTKKQKIKRKHSDKPAKPVKGYRARNRISNRGRASRETNQASVTRPQPRGDKPSKASKRVIPRSPSARPRDIYPQNSRYVNNPSRKPRKTERVASFNRNSRRVASPTESARRHNVYPQRGRFVSNGSENRNRNKRPVSNRRTLARLKKLQGPDPMSPRKGRIFPRSASGSFRPQKSINMMARYPRPKRKSEKASTRDLAGRRLRQKNYETKRPAIISTPGGKALSVTSRQKSRARSNQQFGSFRNFSSRQTRPKGRISRVTPGSASGSVRRVYSQSGDFVNNGSKKPRRTERVHSNTRTLRRLKSLQSQPRSAKRGVIVPRSASGSFTARKSTNTWAHFPRPKGRSGKPYLKDLAGKKLRTKNYQTPPRPVAEPSLDPYNGRKRIGDRPYKGAAAGTYQSRTRGPRAWSGDVANRRIRGIKKPRTPSAGIQRGGYKSASKHGERKGRLNALEPKPPGRGVWGMAGYRGWHKGWKLFGYQGEQYAGSIKRKRPAKGGGSVSGKLWNNRGQALQPRQADDGRAARFQGNLKQRPQQKGGGSVSGRLWNNGGSPLNPKAPSARARKMAGFSGKQKLFGVDPGFNDQGEEYSGNIKTRRPPKGGGTVSGKLWNNQGQPIEPRTPGDSRIARFQGNIKQRPIQKGGGSVSGRLWNNNGSPISPKAPSARARAMAGFSGKQRIFESGPGYNDQGEEFSGSIKTRRPKKGGGSISGKLWNNNESPIAGRVPKGDPRMGSFQGTIKTKRPAKGGGSVSGKLWNNSESPLSVRTPGPAAARMGGYSGTMKISGFRKQYIKNPNASALALRKQRPSKSVYQEGNLQVRVRQPKYVKSPNAAALAIRKTKPSKSTFDAGGLQTKAQQFQYIKNGYVSDKSLKVREPGKAFARAADFQGNIKMQKFKLYEKNRALHPDAKFIRTNKNNVAGEKDALTNFKLWWARLFRKSETQPDHLKEKDNDKKPRYDKGEAGLWYE